MADLNKTRVARVRQFAGTFGNLSAFEQFRWSGDAVQNDKVYLGIIPRGSRVFDLIADFTALGASVTANIGYEKVDSAGPTTDDLDYFAAAANVAAATRIRSSARGFVADEDLYLVVTLAGANPAAGTIEVYPIGVYEGQH